MLDRGELQRPKKSVNLVTHVIFWNYIHDVTLLIMQIYDDDEREIYPNYRYYGRLLSRLTPTVSGEIFGRKYWLPRSEIFYPTLVYTVTSIFMVVYRIYSHP